MSNPLFTADGQLVMRTIAMPRDTNANGDIFGGWIVSQMDLGAGLLAKQRAKSRVATAAINDISFLLPVHVGDVVECYGKLLKVGRTSMTIRIEVWKLSSILTNPQKVTEGTFVFVALDENFKPHTVDRT